MKRSIYENLHPTRKTFSSSHSDLKLTIPQFRLRIVSPLLVGFILLGFIPVHAGTSLVASPTTQTIDHNAPAQMMFLVSFQSWRIVVNWGDGPATAIDCQSSQPCWSFYGTHQYTVLFGQTLTFQGNAEACDTNGLNCASTTFTVTVTDPPSATNGGGGLLHR